MEIEFNLRDRAEIIDLAQKAAETLDSNELIKYFENKYCPSLADKDFQSLVQTSLPKNILFTHTGARSLAYKLHAYKLSGGSYYIQYVPHNFPGDGEHLPNHFSVIHKNPLFCIEYVKHELGASWMSGCSEIEDLEKWKRDNRIKDDERVDVVMVYKVIAKDNYDRDSVSDSLEKDNLSFDEATTLAAKLNDENKRSDKYYMVVPQDHKLFDAYENLP